MSRLALYLIGPPRVELDGEQVHLGLRKATALLAYLAVTGYSHSRDSLATMLWPEYDQTRARSCLRNVLAVLKRKLGGEWLTADWETAGLNPSQDLWLDLHVFRVSVANGDQHGHTINEICCDCAANFEKAVDLYRGEFMAGFSLSDSLMFDEWQLFQTQALRDELACTLERLARWNGELGKTEPAIAYARHWLALDPLHEPAHRCLMRLFAGAGKLSAAVRQFKMCQRVLREELGFPPAEATTELFERICNDRDQTALAPTREPAVGGVKALHLSAVLPKWLETQSPIHQAGKTVVAQHRSRQPDVEPLMLAEDNGMKVKLQSVPIARFVHYAGIILEITVLMLEAGAVLRSRNKSSPSTC